MKESRLLNGKRKVKERVNRDKRMLDLVKKGKLPYLPSIMSWLSQQLDTPSRLIKQEDVDRLMQNAK
ncbi:MAG: hypothetical protein U0793_00360 [Gemmataceae bacterium]